MGKTIVVERHVPAVPEQVFAAWTSPEALAKWWWPRLPGTTYRVQARTGGSFRIQSDAAGIGVEGEFVTFEPPSRMVMTWRFLRNGVHAVEETVEVGLSSALAGTAVTLAHELDDLAGEGNNIRQDWMAALVRLSALFD